MIESIVYLLPVLLFSVIVHECAHGYVAEWWGDPTARMLGRLTLNPAAAHRSDGLDTGARPVAVGIRHTLRLGEAGPRDAGELPRSAPGRHHGLARGAGVEYLLALGMAGVLAVATAISGPGGVSAPVLTLCYYGIMLNLVLAVFNLLPIPPLDGSHVANLPRPAAYAYQSMGQYGLVIVFLLMFIPGLMSTIFLPARIATELLVGFAAGL